MSKSKFIYENKTNYEVGLYSKDKVLLYGSSISKIDFTKHFYKENNKVYLVDESAHNHLGVQYIVIKNKELNFRTFF